MLAMRKSVVVMLAAAGLAALIATTHQVSAQSAAAQCQAAIETCTGACPPALNGGISPSDAPPSINDAGFRCLMKCRTRYSGCMRRAGVKDNTVTGMSPGDPPKRRPKSSLSGVYDGNNILNDTGPGMGTPGPASTGAGRAPSAAPARIY